MAPSWISSSAPAVTRKSQTTNRRSLGDRAFGRGPGAAEGSCAGEGCGIACRVATGTFLSRLLVQGRPVGLFQQPARGLLVEALLVELACVHAGLIHPVGIL